MMKKGELVMITSSQFNCKHCQNRMKLISKFDKHCDKCQGANSMMWSCGNCKFALCPLCSPVHILSNDIIKPEPRFQYYSN